MQNVLFYYTGTGNSLWVAKKLAHQIGDCSIIPVTSELALAAYTKAEKVGFVFPIHWYGPPGKMLEFIDSLPGGSSKYFFALAVSGGQVAKSLIKLKKFMNSRKMPLSAGFEIIMPSNYIIWKGADPKKLQEKRFKKAIEKIERITAVVKTGEQGPVEKGALWENILLSSLNPFFVKYVDKTDKNFWVNEKCNSCETCVKICPAKNIEMKENKPAWLHKCDKCLACLQWCPKIAIEYGKRSAGFDRYHHPEVKLKELLSG
ncbi:MAG: 4Fe-4S dicluster domain-containing protein [bacterium]|nr:4Fe-4S dicluster domain-containing protein [bacterium]